MFEDGLKIPVRVCAVQRDLNGDQDAGEMVDKVGPLVGKSLQMNKNRMNFWHMRKKSNSSIKLHNWDDQSLTRLELLVLRIRDRVFF